MSAIFFLPPERAVAVDGISRVRQSFDRVLDRTRSIGAVQVQPAAQEVGFVRVRGKYSGLIEQSKRILDRRLAIAAHDLAQERNLTDCIGRALLGCRHRRTRIGLRHLIDHGPCADTVAVGEALVGVQQLRRRIGDQCTRLRGVRRNIWRNGRVSRRDPLGQGSVFGARRGKLRAGGRAARLGLGPGSKNARFHLRDERPLALVGETAFADQRDAKLCFEALDNRGPCLRGRTCRLGGGRCGVAKCTYGDCQKNPTH